MHSQVELLTHDSQTGEANIIKNYPNLIPLFQKSALAQFFWKFTVIYGIPVITNGNVQLNVATLTLQLSKFMGYDFSCLLRILGIKDFTTMRKKHSVMLYENKCIKPW